MTVRSPASQQEINEMRDIGRALSDKGFFEIDIVTGDISWANEFALKKLGYVMSELVTMTVFDIVPEEFHESVRNVVADLQSDRGFKFTIRPDKSASGKLIWWYSVRIKSKAPYAWFRSEYLNTTDSFGTEYASMTAAMQTTNSYNDLYNRIQELQVWTEEQVSRLDEKDVELEKKFSEFAYDLKQTKKYAETAANAGLELKLAVVNFQTHVADEMSKQTAEILRLITIDSVHDKRMEAFEKHVQTTTTIAVNAITVKADEAGSGLTKKVTIPVGIVSLLAAIAQWLIQHYLK